MPDARVGHAEAGQIRYHYGFYAAVQFEYEDAGAELDFLQELDLGKEPVRLDMLIVKRRDRDALTDAIGSFFRRYNVLEYKSPEDSLSVDGFYKAQGYACIYKGLGRSVDERPIGEMTVSIFRHACPRRMFADLRAAGLAVEEAHPGVFRVTGALCVPAQVVVTSRLPAGEYGAFKILARNARRADVVRFIQDAERRGSGHAGAVLRVSMAANEGLYQRLREEGPMEDVFESFFHEELAKYRKEGERRGRAKERRVIMDRLVAGGMAPEEAARYTGLSD